MRWLIGAVVIGIMVSCTKEPLPEFAEGNEPIYTMQGVVDGDSLNLAVGDDFGTSISHGVTNENGVHVYFGELDIPKDESKLRIEFLRQEQIRLGGTFNVFPAENVSFLVHKKGTVTFDFGGVGNQNNSFYLQAENGNFVDTDEHTIDQYGYEELTAIVQDYGTQQFNFTIKHGYRDQYLNSRFQAYGLEDTLVMLSEETSATHQWFIDGLLVGTDVNYSGAIQDGVHTLAHKTLDEYGNEATTTGLTRFKGGKEFWTMRINYSLDDEFETYNYGKTIVSMFKDGEWYTSKYTSDNLGNKMKIANVLFVPNETGPYPLYAFDCEFDAVLMNEDKSNSITLTGITGRFLVGLQ